MSSSEGLSSCTFCGPGKRADPSTNRCEECAAGTSSAGGSDVCMACDATVGFVSNIEGQSSCAFCGPGKRADPSTNECEECAAGKSSVGGSDYCNSCSDTEYQPGTSSPTCIPCSVCNLGEFVVSSCSATVDVECNTCSAGKSSTGDECQECAEGKHAASGASFCETVGAGQEVVKEGELRVGTKVSATHKRYLSLCANSPLPSAQLCPAGSYSTGSVDACASCDTGYSNEGASKCEFCGPGDHMIENGLIKNCEACEAGKFSEAGASCLDCTPGTYSNAGASYCATAVAGKRANDDRTGMLVCPANTFSTGSADACSPCTNGGHSQPGSSSCEKCDTGTYVRTSEAEVPHLI